MLNEHELKEIEARCAAATPSNLRLMDDGIIIEDDGSVIADFDSKHDDARLFIHARTDIPHLLAHIRELEAATAHIERALYFQSSRMVEHFRGNMLCCIDKQCADDGGCIECLTAQALAATKESPCPK